MKFFILFLSLIFSCKDADNRLQGTWYSECDPNSKIRFTEDGFFEKYHDGDWIAEEKYFEYGDDGKMVEVDYGKLKYNVTEKNDSILVELIGSKNKKVFGKELIFAQDDYLICVSYKEGENISNHIQSIVRYIKEGKPITYKLERPLVNIIIPETIKNNEFYIAYDQTDGITPVIDEERVKTIIVPINGTLKTTLKEDIYLIANKGYKFYLDDGDQYSALNAWFESDICRIKNDIQTGKTPLNIIYHPESVIVVAHRFNPGRSRIVNKVFREEIKGNVQAFTIDTLKNELFRYGFDINHSMITF